MNMTLFFVLTLGFAGSAFAQKAPLQDPACSDLVKACEQAGYKAGDRKKSGKGLFADCLAKAIKGTAVAGLKMDLSSPKVKTCKESIEAKRQARKNNRGGMGGMGMGMRGAGNGMGPMAPMPPPGDEDMEDEDI